MTDPSLHGPLAVGRYALYERIAGDEFASLHVGALLGPLGFSRTVAIRRLAPIYARDPEFVAAFLDAARWSAHIRHPNVLAILDVVALQGELLLIMDDVVGAPLSALVRSERRRGRRIPIEISVRIVADVLEGLHAVHEATGNRIDCRARRCMSPTNVLVGESGISQVADLVLCTVRASRHTALLAQHKSALGHQAPEHLHHGAFDRRSDVFSAGVILWELLVGSEAFPDSSVRRGLSTPTLPRPGSLVSGVPPPLDRVVVKALQFEPRNRFATAAEMAEAIEGATYPSTTRRVARWLHHSAGGSLRAGAGVAAMQEASSMAQTGPATSSSEQVVMSVAPTPKTSGSITPTIAPVAVNSDGGHESALQLPPRTAPMLVLTVAIGIGSLVFAAWVATQDAGPSVGAAPDVLATDWVVTPTAPREPSDDLLDASDRAPPADGEASPDGSDGDTER